MKKFILIIPVLASDYQDYISIDQVYEDENVSENRSNEEEAPTVDASPTERGKNNFITPRLVG